MSLFRVALPVVLLAGLLFAVADTAEASPVRHGVAMPIAHGGVGVTVGVAAPVRVAPARVAPRRAIGVRHRPGRWVIQERQVWVPGEFLGYDRHGYEVFSEGHYVVERTRVWVPAPRRRFHPHRRAAHVHARPRGYVAVGATFR